MPGSSYSTERGLINRKQYERTKRKAGKVKGSDTFSWLLHKLDLELSSQLEEFPPPCRKKDKIQANEMTKSSRQLFTQQVGRRKRGIF